MAIKNESSPIAITAVTKNKGNILTGNYWCVLLPTTDCGFESIQASMNHYKFRQLLCDYSSNQQFFFFEFFLLKITKAYITSH